MIALLLLVIVSGCGAFLFTVGAIRYPWYRRFKRTHGRPPF
ncbi:hypothetical protein NKH18_34775 [Streptomyces sp. M10(2022)]